MLRFVATEIILPQFVMLAQFVLIFPQVAANARFEILCWQPVIIYFVIITIIIYIHYPSPLRPPLSHSSNKLQIVFCNGKILHWKSNIQIDSLLDHLSGLIFLIRGKHDQKYRKVTSSYNKSIIFKKIQICAIYICLII